MELARRLGVNAAAITRQVKEMEVENLILRRLDARDGRRSYIKLSANGVKTFKNIHDRSHELERLLSLSISREEMASAVDILSRLRRFLKGLE
jgi:MarR family transcriptional regulator for hemolysin